MQVLNILFLAVKSMQKILADGTFCVCIATAVDFSIQVQMNQWKIVWLPVWINFNLLLEVVLYLARVALYLPSVNQNCLAISDRVTVGFYILLAV